MTGKNNLAIIRPLFAGTARGQLRMKCGWPKVFAPAPAVVRWWGTC